MITAQIGTVNNMEISLYYACEEGYWGIRKKEEYGREGYGPYQFGNYDHYDEADDDKLLRVIPEKANKYELSDEVTVDGTHGILVFESKKEAVDFIIDNVPDGLILEEVKQMLKSPKTVDLDL